MALIQTGGGIVNISGSVGGNTYSRNRYGRYMRQKSIPVNPNTARQVVIRAALAYLTARWSDTLTALQRAAWNLYGSNVTMLNKLGETIYLSGFNHYIRSNSIRKQANLSVIDAGPVVFELPAQDPTLLVTGSEATQQLTLAYDDGMDWADEDGGYMAFFQGQPQNAQRNFFAGPWRYLTNIPGVNGAPPASPKIVGVPFAIAEGQRQWCYARILRADGRLSSPFEDDCVTAA